MKLFYKRKYDYTTEYGIFGIKIKLTNSKKKIKNLEQRIAECEKNVYSLLHGERFVYSNAHQLTTSDYKSLISKFFYNVVGYFPDLKNPKTFNEKINWLKLNYYNPIENLCCDKYEVKKYVEEKIGEEFIVPVYGVYNNVNDIDFTKLPNQVVFKNTLSGGDSGVKIIKNLKESNIEELKYELNNLLFNWNNDGLCNCLIPERRLIKERLIAEKYLGALDDDLDDYKFYCFHGKFKLGYVDVRIPNQKGKIYYFDKEWNLLPIKYINHLGDPSFFPQKPSNFDKMIEVAELLAKEFPFVRVDLYTVDNKIYFGELTFKAGGGFNKFNDDWDLKLGEMLDLTNIDKKYLINQKAKIRMVVRERERERVILLPAKKVLKVA